VRLVLRSEKLAAFRYYTHRMITLPITEKSKQEEWKVVLTIAKNNGYPVNTIRDLKTKLIGKKHQQYPLTIPHNEPVSHYVTHDAHHSQAHSQLRTLTQHDMLPQHHINIKELFCECF